MYTHPIIFPTSYIYPNYFIPQIIPQYQPSIFVSRQNNNYKPRHFYQPMTYKGVVDPRFRRRSGCNCK